MRRSILTEKIARRGRHILQEYSVDPMEFVQVRELMTSDPDMLSGDVRIEDARDFFENDARHRSYPVVDATGRLLGLVSRSDALRWRVETIDGGTLLKDNLSDASQPSAFPDSPSGMVADLIVQTGVGRIPIIARDSRRVVGILTRQDLLKARLKFRRAETERTSRTRQTAAASD